MSPFDFLKLILGVWYIAYAVTNTHGPLGVFEWMRNATVFGYSIHGRHGVPMRYRHVEHGEVTVDSGPIYPENGLLDCIICFAPYVALALLLINVQGVRDVLALAGGALLLHSFTGWRFGE